MTRQRVPNFVPLDTNADNMNCLRRLMPTLPKFQNCYGHRFLTSEVSKVQTESEPTDESCDLLQRPIAVEKITDITLIGLNRPEKRNSLNVEMAEALCQALDDFDKDETSHVCILHGMGGNFCAGYDLEEIANFDGDNSGTVPQFSSLGNKTELTSKISIAAISGFAVGAGLELALMCDLRIIEETAVVGFFNRRFGIPTITGGTVRLPGLIGYSRALELLLTGRKLLAKEAFEWGLSNRYTAVGTARGSAMRLGRSIQKFPLKSLYADRASMRYAMFEARTLDEALQFEKDTSSHLVFEEGAPKAKGFVTEKIGRHGNFRTGENKQPNFAELNKELV